VRCGAAAVERSGALRRRRGHGRRSERVKIGGSVRSGLVWWPHLLAGRHFIAALHVVPLALDIFPT
jgi:hypothetical protein